VAEDFRMALTNLLRKAEMAGDVDFLRDGVRILGQTLMDLEVSQHLRAEKNERTPDFFRPTGSVSNAFFQPA